MGLLTAGYWHTTYFPSNYWNDDYWQKYAAVCNLKMYVNITVNNNPMHITVNNNPMELSI